VAKGRKKENRAGLEPRRNRLGDPYRLGLVDALDAASKPGRYGGDVLTATRLSVLLVFVNGVFIRGKAAQTARPSGIVVQIMAYIDSNPGRRLTLESVAAACESAGFYDYDNFIRTFRKIAGKTPGQYGRVPEPGRKGKAS